MLIIQFLLKDHWVNKTGTVGAVGGMGFLAVIMCNVSDLQDIAMWKNSANLDVSVRRYEHWDHHPSQPHCASLA